MRECGKCSMCCRVLGVKELEKPPNTWCSNCAISKGCTIYDTRPESCRSFECLWLQDESIPDHLQPNLTKVVLWSDPDNENRIVANVDADRPEAYKQGQMGIFLQNLAEAGMTIGVEITGNRIVLENKA